MFCVSMCGEPTKLCVTAMAVYLVRQEQARKEGIERECLIA
jgi:hypothetical protein